MALILTCFTRPLFTWLYQKEDGSQIRERLDKALATIEWFHLFPMAKLTHLSCSTSDYSPLILHLFAKPRKKRVGRVFRFESMWLRTQDVRLLWRKLGMRACMEGQVMFLIDVWRVRELDLRCGMAVNLVM